MVELARGVLALSVALEAARQRLAQVEEELARLRETVTDLTEERDRYVLTLEWIRDFAAARDHSIGMGSISRNADAALEAARLREGPE